MSHPYEYPAKTIVPSEGDMPFETIDWERHYPADREGIQGVSIEEREDENRVYLQPPVFGVGGKFVSRDFKFGTTPGEMLLEVVEGPHALLVTTLEGGSADQRHEVEASGYKDVEQLYDQTVSDAGAVSLVTRAVIEMRSSQDG